MTFGTPLFLTVVVLLYTFVGIAGPPLHSARALRERELFQTYHTPQIHFQGSEQMASLKLGLHLKELARVTGRPGRGE